MLHKIIEIKLGKLWRKSAENIFVIFHDFFEKNIFENLYIFPLVKN